MIFIITVIALVISVQSEVIYSSGPNEVVNGVGSIVTGPGYYESGPVSVVNDGVGSMMTTESIPGYPITILNSMF